MKCPVCNGVELKMSERQGVEIDYCPQCRGIWLDRGELDKIIERSNASMSGGKPERSGDHEHSRGYESHEHPRGHEHGHKKKRESFLSDLFDF